MILLRFVIANYKKDPRDVTLKNEGKENIEQNQSNKNDSATEAGICNYCNFLFAICNLFVTQ